VASADVDPHVFQLGWFLAVLLLEQVRGLLSDNANDVAAPPQNPQSLSHDDLLVPSAKRSEPQHPFFVDVGNDEPNLVDVPGENDGWPLLSFLPGADSVV